MQANPSHTFRFGRHERERERAGSSLDCFQNARCSNKPPLKAIFAARELMSYSCGAMVATKPAIAETHDRQSIEASQFCINKRF